MKDSKRFLFKLMTIEGRALYLAAGCMHEALDKMSEHIDEGTSEDFVISVKMVNGDFIVEDGEELDLNGVGDKPKLSVVPPDPAAS
jgi:hypothetical protein